MPQKTPCTSVIKWKSRAGQEKLGSPENPMAGCWEETCYLSCQWDTLLPLGPQHSWLLVPSHLLFLRSREKSPEASFQPVTALMGILLFPFLPSASEELPLSVDSAQHPRPCVGAPNSQHQDLPNSGQTLGGLNFLNQ